MELEIGKLFGLPAHPLLVHIPVVLTPLLFAGGVAAAVSGTWRRRLGIPLVILGVVLAIGTQLSIGSGEALKEAVRRTALVRRHVGQSDLLEPVVLLFLAALCGLVLADYWHRGRLVPRRLARALTAQRTRVLVVLAAVATVATGATATGLVVRAGHSGAKATWEKNSQIVKPIGG